MKFLLEEATLIIQHIRELLEAKLHNNELPSLNWNDPKAKQNRGLFVTLKKDSKLRGCIGFPEPILPFKQALKEAALSAAFSDPRFPALSAQEWPSITIEISILTEPELIQAQPKQLPENITIGRDGLIIRSKLGSGLLLPQVFAEYNCTPKQALEMTCQKAGLPPEAWQNTENKIYRFEAQIFKEVEPAGSIIQEQLS